MTERFIVFDTETPNFRNNRMSAIGISVVENGVITQEFYSLVNPEAEFDAFNIRLTGITPESVETAPTFPQLWQEIQPLFDSGMLVVVPGADGGYRLGRAVNSLTTLTPDHGAAFQKIKVVEGVDLIRKDIASAFESGYIGKVLNDYDNKLLLVTAINAYLKGLEGDVLDKTADNRCFVSLSGQKSWLESQGTDTSDMKDADILRANTGSEVFLEADLTFCDAMEDLSLVIAM